MNPLYHRAPVGPCGAKHGHCNASEEIWPLPSASMSSNKALIFLRHGSTVSMETSQGRPGSFSCCTSWYHELYDMIYICIYYTP